MTANHQTIGGQAQKNNTKSFLCIKIVTYCVIYFWA